MALEESANVEFIYLFGSVALNKSHKGSDIDICICFDGTNEEAYNFMIKAISAVKSNIFDIKLFRQLPLYIKIDVFKGKMLYSRDIKAVYNIAYDTIRDYEEFEHRFYDYIGKEAMH